MPEVKPNIEDKKAWYRINVDAIAKVKETYGDLTVAVEFTNPNNIISYLNRCGLRCVECGKQNISWRVFAYMNYDPHVLCFDCQRTIPNWAQAGQYASTTI